MNEKEAIVDEYGELERRIAEFKPTLDRAKKLKEAITSWFEGTAPEDSGEAHGQLYTVRIGPRANQRSISSMRKLYKLLGVQTFLEWCNFPLGALDKIPVDTSALVIEERAGPRPIKCVANASPAVSKAA